MRSSVLTFEVWHRDRKYWLVLSVDDGVAGSTFISQSETLADDIHAARANGFCMQHRLWRFVAEMMPWENEDE